MDTFLLFSDLFNNYFFPIADKYAIQSQKFGRPLYFALEEAAFSSLIFAAIFEASKKSFDYSLTVHEPNIPRKGTSGNYWGRSDILWLYGNELFIIEVKALGFGYKYLSSDCNCAIRSAVKAYDQANTISFTNDLGWYLAPSSGRTDFEKYSPISVGIGGAVQIIRNKNDDFDDFVALINKKLTDMRIGFHVFPFRWSISDVVPVAYDYDNKTGTYRQFSYSNGLVIVVGISDSAEWAIKGGY